MSARAKSSRTVGVLAAAMLLLVGCGSDEPDPVASPSPSPSASVDAPTPLAEIDASMLLPAQDMPPWNGAITWQETASEDLVVEAPACSLPTPDSLGAVSSFTATYSADAAMTGSNTIMLFPDEATAQAALESLEAAMPDCLGQEDGRGQITDETAASSWTGSRDCAFTADPACDDNAMLFEFIGVGAQANTAAIVSYSLIGQDANYCLDPEICPDPRDPVLPEVVESLERMNGSA